MAICLTEQSAEDLKTIVERDYANCESNPNREFFIRPIKFEFTETI